MSERNETLELIFQRRSIRKFKKLPISDEIIREIVLAGQRAPTGCTYQAYSFIRILDAEKRKRIIVACGDKLWTQNIDDASEWILICPDLHRFQRVLDHIGHDHNLKHGYGLSMKIFSLIDSCLAAENMILAAESVGLTSLVVGVVIDAAEEISQILNLPTGVLPLMLLCIGYANEDPPTRPRWALDAVLHTDGYRELNTSEIDTFFQTMERKLKPENDYASSQTREYIEQLKKKTDMSEEVKASDEKLLNFLRKNGFIP